MSSAEHDLEAFIEAHLAHLEGDGPRPSLDALPAELRGEAAARIQILEAVHGALADAPLPEDDPVARHFGFDRANQYIAINGRRVASLRQQRNLKLNEFAKLVHNAGGTEDMRFWFQAQELASVEVPPRTASAVAAVLRAPVQDFEAGTSPAHAFAAQLEDIEAVVAQWAAEHGADARTAMRKVEQALSAAKYRAESVSTEHLIEIVRQILQGLE